MKWFNLFLNKWLGYLVAIIILQQVLVALGTYSLGKFSNEFPSEGFQIHIAIALFISIFLPGTIIHYLFEYYLTRAAKSSQLAYLNQYANNNFNHPSHFRSESFKEKKHGVMSRSGQDAINKALFFFSDMASTSLNVLFNTLSVILVTDLWFGIIILISGSLGTLIIYLSKNKIVQSSRTEMLSDTKLNEHLNKSWDNIILGNQLFYTRWVNLFHDLFQESEKASINAIRNRNRPVALAGMITNGLVLGSALFIAWFHQNNLGMVMSILVMLPRSLQIVMHIQICQSYFAQWKHLKEKLIMTQETLLKPSTTDLTQHIDEDKIKMNNHSVRTADLINTIANIDSGRLTISGENGSGKSTLMLILKQKFGSSAVYLPTHHQFILKESRLKLSSGETTLNALEDIKNEECKIFLLDEWDANLSTDNKDRVNKMLNNLSLKKIIVEVRHS